MSRKSEHLKDEGSKLQVVAAGATAGLISRFVIAPLDVVKIRLQLQTHSANNPAPPGSIIYKGTLPTIRHILKHEGLRALWKGNVPAELMYVSYSAVQFATYRSSTLLLHRLFGSETLPNAAESFIAGAAGGAAATAATYPLDLLRTRFAAQGNDRVYEGLLRAVADIRRDEGLTGYFRGIGAGLGSIVPYMGMFFATYETLRLPLGGFWALPFGSGDAAAGVIASVIAKTATFPLDLVRKRIQVQGPTRERYVNKNIPEYSGTVRTMRMIFAAEGVRGLYRGLVVSLIKAAPASAVTMWTYERALKIYIGLGETSDLES
ncbi:mitochondrial thiamine pyrophosphate carrier 1 [Coniochaeta sp. 2T2.1]|nr:mitochondrial thiamine pyrophosphate carrier 1 [Coniochaeta sp. 2T2.1]